MKRIVWGKISGIYTLGSCSWSRTKDVFEVLSNIQANKNKELSIKRVYIKEPETRENQAITVISGISSVVHT